MFQVRLVQAWARQMSGACLQDEHYPAIIHLSEALQGLGADGVECRRRAAASLARGVSLLKEAGAAFVAAPCNSLGEVLTNCTGTLGLEVFTPWNSAPAMRQPASTAVLCSKSMRAYLSARYPELIFPSDAAQAAVQLLIEQGMAGQAPSACLLQALISEQLRRGVAEVRIACTELSCAQLEPDERVLDTMNCLVRATADRAQALFRASFQAST
ncbi:MULTISPECIES: aspartate/glutamate racemase family protein [unclassified Variovorax]|uniref:aspartate/glutamate racemase family protein n=1 Tax=unclassified Variovorax TaxID=663243 RepID=UPI001392376F|nr:MULTISPECIES: aspartate/glutamate racemase family protein [unclassified Variovorax]